MRIVFFLFGHIARMPDETDAEKILTAAPLENWMRPPGCPRQHAALVVRCRKVWHFVNFWHFCIQWLRVGEHAFTIVRLTGGVCVCVGGGSFHYSFCQS